jgi:hypothetical protein
MNFSPQGIHLGMFWPPRPEKAYFCVCGKYLRFPEPERRGWQNHPLNSPGRRSGPAWIDADPQQSSMKWSTFRAGENRFRVVAMAKPTLHKDLGPIYADYTDIVIDGPPRIHIWRNP